MFPSVVLFVMREWTEKFAAIVFARYAILLIVVARIYLIGLTLEYRRIIGVRLYLT